jgi:hypothetical protein
MVADEMTREGTLLNDVRAWFAGHKVALAKRGLRADLRESPRDRDKQSVSVTIASDTRIGQLVVWSTGEAELSMGDVASREVVQEHREITSRLGLKDATETLVSWISPNRSPQSTD